MPSIPVRRPVGARLAVLLLAGGLSVSLANVSPAKAADTLPEPQHAAVAGVDSAAVLLAARRYAAFWNSGDESLAAAALAPGFIDRTLPPGRSQGPGGPLEASKVFRAAVPDLTAAIEDIVVADDRAAVHYRFRGRFTGRFGDVQGQGQTVDFQAFDLYRVRDGRITDNWHLEDNLILLRQLGLSAP
jgi:predicted ester cyclase